MRSIQSDEKERVCQIYHRDTHYYVIISHNTSVPMVGHFGIGYWNAYITCLMGVAYKNLSVKSDFSQIARIIGFLIMNATNIILLSYGTACNR